MLYTSRHAGMTLPLVIISIFFLRKKVAVVVLFRLKGRNGFIFGNWKKVFSSKKRDFITPQGRAKACLFKGVCLKIQRILVPDSDLVIFPTFYSYILKFIHI